MSYTEHNIVWDTDKVTRLWDYYSRTSPFSEIYVSKLMGDRILRHCSLPLKVPLEVLDFGCGPGFIWDHLLNLGARWNYTALDSSQESVTIVRQKGQGNPQFRGAQRLHRFPTDLPAGEFDAALVIEVVEHLGDEHLHGTLTELARLLRKGGMLVLTTPDNEDLAVSNKFCPECGAIFHEWQHIRSWTSDALTAHMSGYGFRLRKCRTLDFADRRGLHGIVSRAIRWLLRSPMRAPHLVLVYEKQLA